MAISLAGEASSNSRIAASISSLARRLVPEQPFERADLIHVFLLLIHQADCERFFAVTVRAGGNVQKLRPEISTSIISDLRNSSA